jgi:hypothetical protein
VQYIVEMASDGMMNISSFMTTGSGFQATLRHCLSNLRGCGIGITDGREYAFRWLRVA